MERLIAKIVWALSLVGFAWTYKNLPQPDGFTVALGVFALMAVFKLIITKPQKK
jgi:hypothetical protein